MIVWSQARHLKGITLFENELFVSNWFDDTVYKINKYTGESSVAVNCNKSAPYAIHAYHRQRQPFG